MTSVMSRPGELAVVQRPMTMVDLDRVMTIEVQAYPFPWTRGHFSDSLAAGYLASLRVQGDDVLGYYVAMPGVDELHLLNLTVAPAQQGQGHARALLAHLAEASRAYGAAQIWLEVRQSNERAQRLYQQWGFQRAGLRKNYYPAAHGRREHAVVMCWRLPAPAVTRTDIDSGRRHAVD